MLIGKTVFVKRVSETLGGILAVNFDLGIVDRFSLGKGGG
jgi:hypothetical protein